MDERYETQAPPETREITGIEALRRADLSTDDARTAGLISVGKVAAVTGISAHALRMWERRYGTPRPVRLASGHRRYTPEQVDWLRLVGLSLRRGDRPGRALRRTAEELRTSLQESSSV